MRLARLSLVVFLVLAVQAMLSTSAFAVTGPSCQAPPGLSGLDQYCESIPGAGGSGGHHSGHPLSSHTVKQLESQGVAGRTVLALTGTAPATGGSSSSGSASRSSGATHQSSATHTKRHHHATGTGASSPNRSARSAGSATPAASTSHAPANNPVSAVGSSVSSSAFAGGFLWLLLGIAAVMMGTAWLGWARRRTEQQ